MRQMQKETAAGADSRKNQGIHRSNGLKTGDKLPNEFQLAEICGVGRSTMRGGYKASGFSGKVAVINGSGTYIKEKAPQASPAVNDDPMDFGKQ